MKSKTLIVAAVFAVAALGAAAVPTATLALADKPEGPWRKSASNSILRRFRGLRGTGHHSLFKDKDGKWRIVFHTRASPTEVGMRRTYIADLIVGDTPDAPELSVGGELIPCMLEP